MLNMLKVGICLLVCSLSLRAEVRFAGGGSVRVATVAEGRQVLQTPDDFVARLSPFDRAARLKTDRAVSEQEFLTFVSANVVDFTPDEIAALNRALENIKPKVATLRLFLPETVLIVKTTGQEEGHAAYTRANAIVLPVQKLIAKNRAKLEDLLTHELFHVLSRKNATYKEKLYNIIGFQACQELAFPPSLLRITNPDAPKNDHYLNVESNGKKISVIPILYAKTNVYNVQKGGEFFTYLNFKLLAVEITTEGHARYNLSNPTLLDPSEVTGFFTQIGQNTGYIIHPEEILADNFVHLLNGTEKLKSPEIVAKMRQVFLP